MQWGRNDLFFENKWLVDTTLLTDSAGFTLFPHLANKVIREITTVPFTGKTQS